MSVIHMSPLSRSLYEYKEDFIRTFAEDQSFTGQVNYHLVGRILTLATSFILHAEAVCRAVYVCFLSIQEIFSSTDEELLLTQKNACATAIKGSLRSFASFFTLETDPLPAPALVRQVAGPNSPAQPLEGNLEEEKKEDEGFYTFMPEIQLRRLPLADPFHRSQFFTHFPDNFSYQPVPVCIDNDPRFIKEGAQYDSADIGLCHFTPPTALNNLNRLNPDHIAQLLEGGALSPSKLAADLVYSAAIATHFKQPLSVFVVSSRSGFSSRDSFEPIERSDMGSDGDSLVHVDMPELEVPFGKQEAGDDDLVEQSVPSGMRTPTLSKDGHDFDALSKHSSGVFV